MKLIENGNKVIGVDNLNDYYDVNLKKERLSELKKEKEFNFYKIDISNKIELETLFRKNKIDFVINLAAQAGVRYSINNPDKYIDSNIIGFYNLLEVIRNHPVKHLVYASSSSVYGANNKVPFSEDDFVDNPVSLYAATKKTNELMAHTYSHLYKIPCTGLRFFTVYGPKGRPDMAYYTFTDKFFRNESIDIFNNGDFKNDMYRDFTYIDDIIEGIIKVLDKPPIDIVPQNRVLNIGNNNPVKLMEFIEILEEELSKSFNRKIVFKKNFVEIKPGDVQKTFSSTLKLEELTGFKPKTTVREGLRKFSEWYKERSERG